MRAQRLSVMAVGALAVLGAVPYTAVSAQAATSTAATASTAAPATAPEPATELIVEGQQGDMVTNGFTGVETGPAYALQAHADNNNTVFNPPTSDLSFQSIHNGDINDPTSFGLAFFMPNGQQWAVGQTYTNTEGIVFGGGSQPWFYFSQFNTGPCGRPSNVIGAEDDKGTVKIDDLTWTNGVNSQVASMEVEFTQSCHGGPVTRGVFRYNETGPLPPGAPTGRPLPAGQGTVAPLTFRRGTSIISAPTGAVDGPRLATVSSESEGATTWNPLGTRLLYSSDPGLSTVHPDGTGAAPLTETPDITTRDTEPAESWDGSIVAFIQRNGSGTGTLSIETTDGSTAGSAYHLPTGVSCADEHSPSWAGDGSLIFECDNAGSHATYRLGGGAATQLIPNSSQAAFSNDGTKIAFVRPDGGGVPQIFTANADGSGATQVSHDPNGATKPAWSGDGKVLAYANEAFHEILEIPSAGGDPVGSIPNADDPDFTPPVVDSNVIRQAGSDRIGTAIAASRLNFANRGAADQLRPHAGAVVLARSDTFADALGGSALAVRENAPLLITGSAGLNPAVKTEIGRVLAPGGTVYLLGGTQALSPAVAAALSGYHVVRLAGDTRYGTAVAIAKKISPHPTSLVIATGAVFPDALAAGATGEPVLLTDGASMPQETLAYLKTLNPDPATGGTELVTVGGPGDAALISAYKAGKLPSWPSEISRLKLAGADRYATALEVAQAYFSANFNAALATGSTWPDALSGGAMIGHRGGPLLLTAPTGISPAVLDYLRSQSASLYDLFLMGGPAALPNAIGQQAAGVIGLPGHVRIGGVFAAAGEVPSGAKDDASGAPKSGAKSEAKVGGTARTAPVGDLSPVSREG